jgi:hypothetical protein
MKVLTTLECDLDHVTEKAVSYRDTDGNTHYFSLAIFGKTFVPRVITLDVSVEDE